MRICLVMGAGASLANGQHFRPIRRTATHPPLDFTFFQKIAELKFSVPDDLAHYAASLPTGSPFLSGVGGGGRMEEFLRDLFHDFLQQRATSTSEPVRHIVSSFVSTRTSSAPRRTGCTRDLTPAVR